MNSSELLERSQFVDKELKELQDILNGKTIDQLSVIFNISRANVSLITRNKSRKSYA